MKSWSLLRLFGLTCSVLMFSASSIFAFEGKIDMTMTSTQKEGGVIPMTYYIKDKRIRIEMKIPAEKSEKKGKGGEMGTMAVIYNLQAHEVIMLMPQQNMYMAYPIPETVSTRQSKAARPSPDSPQKPGMQFKATGRKENIAGLEAEEYVGVSENKYTEVWVTKGMGEFMMANQARGGGPMGGGPMGAPKGSGWEAFTQQGQFYPLRVIQRDKEGAPESFRMETTHIDRTPPSDTLFVPPAEYKKFELPNMGDAMRGMIPGSQR